MLFRFINDQVTDYLKSDDVLWVVSDLYDTAAFSPLVQKGPGQADHLA